MPEKKTFENTQVEEKKTKKLSESKYFELLADGWKNFSFIFIFVFIFAAYLIINGQATSWSGIMNIFRHTATNVGIIAIGMGIVILTGDIDLSVGAIVCLVASMTIEVYNATNGSLLIALLFAVLLGALLGFVNGIFVGQVKVPAFIATLGTSLIFRSIAQYILSEKGKPTYVAGRDFKSWSLFYKIGNADILTIPIVTIIFLIIAAVLIYISRMTKFGKQIYAVGSNEKAARLSGINVKLIRISVFTLSGLLAGVTGFITVGRLGSLAPSTLGVGYDIDSIAAVVIGGIAMSGGRGSILGTVFGAISFTIIDKIIVSLGVNPFLNGIIRGGILLAAVILQLLQRNKSN